MKPIICAVALLTFWLATPDPLASWNENPPTSIFRDYAPGKMENVETLHRTKTSISGNSLRSTTPCHTLAAHSAGRKADRESGFKKPKNWRLSQFLRSQSRRPVLAFVRELPLSKFDSFKEIRNHESNKLSHSVRHSRRHPCSQRSHRLHLSANEHRRVQRGNFEQESKKGELPVRAERRDSLMKRERSRCGA